MAVKRNRSAVHNGFPTGKRVLTVFTENLIRKKKACYVLIRTCGPGITPNIEKPCAITPYYRKNHYVPAMQQSRKVIGVYR
jgi:hypothetical protein